MHFHISSLRMEILNLIYRYQLYQATFFYTQMFQPGLNVPVFYELNIPCSFLQRFIKSFFSEWLEHIISSLIIKGRQSIFIECSSKNNSRQRRGFTLL